MALPMHEVQHFYAPDLESWRRWLEDNHEKEMSVWLVYDKGKNRTFTWQNIVEEALCYGWIDSRPGKVSDTQSKIYVSKRKPNSVWSKINKNNVERLINEGRMKPSGMQSITVARQNGSWDALNLSDNLVIPHELSELFETDTAARSNFERFSVGSKRNTLQWIYDAKTEKTKQQRIATTFNAAKENRRVK